MQRRFMACSCAGKEQRARREQGFAPCHGKKLDQRKGEEGWWKEQDGEKR